MVIILLWTAFLRLLMLLIILLVCNVYSFVVQQLCCGRNIWEVLREEHSKKTVRCHQSSEISRSARSRSMNPLGHMRCFQRKAHSVTERKACHPERRRRYGLVGFEFWGMGSVNHGLHIALLAAWWCQVNSVALDRWSLSLILPWCTAYLVKALGHSISSAAFWVGLPFILGSDVSSILRTRNCRIFRMMADKVW